MKILANHHSQETAFEVSDYPYSWKLRCRIRYWLEIHPKKGTRFCSQTTNPRKAGEVWNAVKKSTYSIFGVMVQYDDTDGKPDEVGHIHWIGMSCFNIEESQEFLDKYRAGLTETQQRELAYLAKCVAARQAKAAAAKALETSNP